MACEFFTRGKSTYWPKGLACLTAEWFHFRRIMRLMYGIEALLCMV